MYIQLMFQSCGNLPNTSRPGRQSYAFGDQIRTRKGLRSTLQRMKNVARNMRTMEVIPRQGQGPWAGY